MEYTVRQREDAVGTVAVTENKRTVTFEVCCQLNTREILRCYGVTDDPQNPLLLGVLEPKNGGLYLHRILTRQTLAQAGCASHLPEAYYLYGNTRDAPQQELRDTIKTDMQNDSPEAIPVSPLSPDSSSSSPPQTGDELVDAAVAAGGIRVEQRGDTLRLTCPFDPEAPFPLAFAFACCRIETCGRQKFFILEMKSPAQDTQLKE